MIGKWHPWLLPACFLGLLSAGCCPPTFYVETSLHPDGSCDRMIWQPKDWFLPDEALTPEWKSYQEALQKPGVKVLAVEPELFKPEWKARWKTVSDTDGPHGGSRSGRGNPQCQYFIARGSFRSPRDIPSHYRVLAPELPEVGASELQRTYERKDYSFVVEHRWSEKITNIVTLPGFLKARDEGLDLVLTWTIESIEKEFGGAYDVSRLATYIRTDVRRFLEDGLLILYDAAVRHRILRDDGTMDPELTGRLAELVKRFGFEPLVRDPKKGVEGLAPEIDRWFLEACRRMVRKQVRHRDGTALTEAEADALIKRAEKSPTAWKPDERQEKQFQHGTGLALLRMTGLYDPLAFLFMGGPPQYEFALRFPGELIETNGTILGAGQTRWKFSADQMFPDGYEMKARSLAIDREGQKRVLGRVAIGDVEKALEFLDLIGDDESLLDAVRKVRETGDRSGLKDEKSRSSEQNQCARRLRELLFNP
jgi:hypothetical protein